MASVAERLSTRLERSVLTRIESDDYLTTEALR
jgi:hypothetical protein